MKEKTCGNCKSKNLIPIKQKYNAYYSPHISIGIGKRVRVSKTVCGDCGHIDEWVASESGLAEIKKKYSN